MAEVQRLIGNVAATPASVLITGESGTGKELVARMIHLASPRRDAVFVAVNCAAIPDTLIESELFGHEKGAFTGATQARAGKFELAAGGTLFLDEIGELPLPLQAKLLRVLQEKTFTRLGSNREMRAAYIFQNSTANYGGKNYVSYRGGGGIQATDRLFISALIKGSNSRVEGGDAPSEGRLTLNFRQSRRVSWEVYGAMGFTNASPAMGGGLILVYQF